MSLGLHTKHIIMYVYYTNLYHYIFLLFMSKSPFYIATAYNRTCFELTTYHSIWFVSDCLMDALYLVVINIFIMDLVIYDAHIIHYHMDPLWLVTVVWSYFTHPDYLVIHCWIWATLLHPTIITPLGTQSVWRYVWIFERVVGYMLNCFPCYCIIIIFHSLFPHITTTFPLL